MAFLDGVEGADERAERVAREAAEAGRRAAAERERRKAAEHAARELVEQDRRCVYEAVDRWLRPLLTRLGKQHWKGRPFEVEQARYGWRVTEITPIGPARGRQFFSLCVVFEPGPPRFRFADSARQRRLVPRELPAWARVVRRTLGVGLPPVQKTVRGYWDSGDLSPAAAIAGLELYSSEEVGACVLPPPPPKPIPPSAEPDRGPNPRDPGYSAFWNGGAGGG